MSEWSYWTSDTNRPIRFGERQFPITMVYEVDGEQRRALAYTYDGFGEFGDMDFYVALALMNPSLWMTNEWISRRLVVFYPEELRKSQPTEPTPKNNLVQTVWSRFAPNGVVRASLLWEAMANSKIQDTIRSAGTELYYTVTKQESLNAFQEHLLTMAPEEFVHEQQQRWQRAQGFPEILAKQFGREFSDFHPSTNPAEIHTLIRNDWFERWRHQQGQDAFEHGIAAFRDQYQSKLGVRMPQLFEDSVPSTVDFTHVVRLAQYEDVNEFYYMEELDRSDE